MRCTLAEIKSILEGRVSMDVDAVDVAAASNACGHDSPGDEGDHFADDGGAHSGDEELGDQDAGGRGAGAAPNAPKPRPELTAMRLLTECKRLPDGMGLALRWI